MPIDVFISYRGADRVLARKLEQRLRSRWGSRVFRDETGLMAGRSWATQLEDAMKCAKVMVALIGPGWHIRDSGEDWVRNELLGAIEAGNAVLPVLVGNPDHLKERLGELPEAFNKQAVNVSEELAGFDLHKIQKALRDLGAFGDRFCGGLSLELSQAMPELCKKLISQLSEGRSFMIAGASGFGRRALLQRMADDVKRQGGLVAASGVELSSRSRQTHGVIASWIDGLCELHNEKLADDHSGLGAELVSSVLEFGPDLLARGVLRPASLLPLGDDESDQLILDAAQRSIDRWAPFPPERLVSQSMSVIENFVSVIKTPVTLIVDNIESIDGSSKDLVRRLLRSPLDNLQLVLATSKVSESCKAVSAESISASALNIDLETVDVCFNKFETVSLHDIEEWGEPGVIVQSWLNQHHVRLADGVGDIFRDANPYYTLSALWYLVDNGYLVQKPDVAGAYLSTSDADDKRISSPDETSSTGSSGADFSGDAFADDDFVTWTQSHTKNLLTVPSRERLLDHMIEEFVPIRFRTIIEVGALIGRRFLFSAAFAAVHPPETIDNLPPSSEAIKRWRVKADRCWEELWQTDPDSSVIVCHYSADNERMINLAQADLVTHLVNKVDSSTKLKFHKRLAEYFLEPIADDTSATLDDKYRNARAAATHWASAAEVRNAADAERVAAGFAEKALAYPEARRHYQRAIRLFTQILAKREHRSTYNLVDHEDLLILANCLYRLGQMTRLANARGSCTLCSTDPVKYFRQALKRLQQLSKNLHNRQLVAPVSRKQTVNTIRDLPEPNLIRHHIRLCETLSGWVKLEMAEWLGNSDPVESRSLLFDALRHAESARGEADSRWLLAAASAQLAVKLVEKALEAQQARKPVRSHNLAIEAQFNIERVIGLSAVSPDEERNLEEPRSKAWAALGQLFQTIALQPKLAEWAFMRMNDHRHEVSDLVDKMTDRQHGMFLLSTQHRDTSAAQTRKARMLLERHKRWAIESGIVYEHSGAYAGLALLELTQQVSLQIRNFEKARMHVDSAKRCASDAQQKQDAFLLEGLLHALERTGHDGIAYNNVFVLQAFRQAGLDDLTSDSSEQEILSSGWRTMLISLLRWCPFLEQLVEVEKLLQEPLLAEDAGWSRHRFFCALLNERDGELRSALNRAKAYLKSATSDQALPANDSMIWRLLESRVPSECYKHACRARETARQLLDSHSDILGVNDEMLTLYYRDIEYAIAVHEWYRSTDPSRLLTLARESNMSIDGYEWASPKLLSGRLAINVLYRQYGAAEEIGQQRLRRIESMVTNWAKGSKDADYLEQIFYISVQMEEPAHGNAKPQLHYQRHLLLPLGKAYRLSLEEREKLVQQAGIPLVQDLHLFDVYVNLTGDDKFSDDDPVRQQKSATGDVVAVDVEVS